MYVVGNPKTKKALREMVAAGDAKLLAVGVFDNPYATGITYVEGPHYPQPHRWYAKVEVEKGLIVKVVE